MLSCKFKSFQQLNHIGSILQFILIHLSMKVEISISYPINTINYFIFPKNLPCFLKIYQYHRSSYINILCLYIEFDPTIPHLWISYLCFNCCLLSKIGWMEKNILFHFNHFIYNLFNFFIYSSLSIFHSKFFPSFYYEVRF
jgi:hypothetical protein